MTDGDLLDAREAMSMLGINEAELQTMVARGDLRAFRSAGTMKFRRDDVLGLKSEKKTDPTIIMPAGTPAAKKPGSGILPTVSATKPRAPSSRNLPAVKPSGGGSKATIPTRASSAPPPDSGTSSDQIILEEFELAPSESEQANTQQITAQQTAISGNVTAVDNETSNVTVVEPGVSPDDEANATASQIAPIAVASAQVPAVGTSSSARAVPTKAGSTRIGAAETAAAPAMSRVRAAVGASSQSSANKRAQATATARSAGPLVTLGLIVTAFFSMLTVTVIGVQMFKGNYDRETGNRVIPPFLAKMPIVSYETTYHNLPGTPADNEGDRKRPPEEFPASR